VTLSWVTLACSQLIVLAAVALAAYRVGARIGRRRMTEWAGDRAREVEEGRRRWAAGEGIPRQRRADPPE
jgi:hypothetical protein